MGYFNEFEQIWDAGAQCCIVFACVCRSLVCVTLESFPQLNLEWERKRQSIYIQSHWILSILQPVGATEIDGTTSSFFCDVTLTGVHSQLPSYKSMSSFSLFNTEQRKLSVGRERRGEINRMKKCLWWRSADSALPAADGGDRDRVLKLSWQPSLGDREVWASQGRWGRNGDKLKGVSEREELLVWHVAFSFRAIFCGGRCWQFGASCSIFSLTDNVLCLHCCRCCGGCCCCYRPYCSGLFHCFSVESLRFSVQVRSDSLFSYCSFHKLLEIWDHNISIHLISPLETDGNI